MYDKASFNSPEEAEAGTAVIGQLPADLEQSIAARVDNIFKAFFVNQLFDGDVEGLKFSIHQIALFAAANSGYISAETEQTSGGSDGEIHQPIVDWIAEKSNALVHRFAYGAGRLIGEADKLEQEVSLLGREIALRMMKTEVQRANEAQKSLEDEKLVFQLALSRIAALCTSYNSPTRETTLMAFIEKIQETIDIVMQNDEENEPGVAIRELNKKAIEYMRDDPEYTTADEPIDPLLTSMIRGAMECGYEGVDHKADVIEAFRKAGIAEVEAVALASYIDGPRPPRRSDESAVSLLMKDAPPISKTSVLRNKFVGDVVHFNLMAGRTMDRFDVRQSANETGYQCSELCEKLTALYKGWSPKSPALFTLMETVVKLGYLSHHFRAGDLDECFKTADPVELLDGDIDVAWVSIGSMMAQGADIFGALAHVAERNLAKATNGKMTLDQYGKIVKPEGWVKPNLAPYLNALFTTPHEPAPTEEE